MDIPAEAVEVYLGGNAITSLPAGVFSTLYQCNILGLQNNQICSIEEGAFDSLGSLKMLLLGGNNIDSIGGVNQWRGLLELKQLYLDVNHISHLEEGAFEPLHQLETLYLFRNEISRIQEGALFGLDRLKQLFLSSNQISVIETKSFSGMFSLEMLFLEHNQISYVEEGAFDSLYSLRFLTLVTNNLTTLSPDLFINMPRPLEMPGPLVLLLSAVDTEDTNQWNCSSLCWLKHEEYFGTVTDFALPRCYSTEFVWSALECGDNGKNLSQLF